MVYKNLYEKFQKPLFATYSSVSVRLSLFLSLFLCDLCEHQWCSLGGSHTGADWDHNSVQALWPREAPKCPKVPKNLCHSDLRVKTVRINEALLYKLTTHRSGSAIFSTQVQNRPLRCHQDTVKNTS